MMEIAATILFAAPIAILGAHLLFRTHAHLAEQQRAHDLRLADRLARGTDAYQDELRSLDAYRPISSLVQRRVFGALLLSLALAIVFIQFVSE